MDESIADITKATKFHSGDIVTQHAMIAGSQTSIAGIFTAYILRAEHGHENIFLFQN